MGGKTGPLRSDDKEIMQADFRNEREEQMGDTVSAGKVQSKKVEIKLTDGLAQYFPPSLVPELLA